MSQLKSIEIYKLTEFIEISGLRDSRIEIYCDL